jgi:hypothetical protein
MDGYRLCLPACGEGDSCPSGQACLSSFGGLPINTSVCLPGAAGAQDGDACTGFQDCGPSSTCWKDLEHPGGYCSAYSCTLGTNAGCNGGTCIEFKDGPSTGTVCVAACTTDLECRVTEGYKCYDPDGLGGVGAYCRRPHVGDACLSSEDCGDGFTCKTDAGWSGGYCTASGCPVVGSTAGCSSGSVCASVDGANTCVDRCTGIGSQGTCRSDYTCQAVVTGGAGACLVPES